MARQVYQTNVFSTDSLVWTSHREHYRTALVLPLNWQKADFAFPFEKRQLPWSHDSHDYQLHWCANQTRPWPNRDTSKFLQKFFAPSQRAEKLQLQSGRKKHFQVQLLPPAVSVDSLNNTTERPTFKRPRFERLHWFLPSIAVFTFSSEKINMILELQLEDIILVDVVAFWWSGDDVAQKR